jgi:hypothetical protein
MSQWYAESPWKEILAAVAGVTTAAGLGLVIHKWTGGAVTIEVKNEVEAGALPAAAPATAIAEGPVETAAPPEATPLPADTPPPPPPTATAVAVLPVVKHVKAAPGVVGGAAGAHEELAFAPAAPAAAGAPAAALAEEKGVKAVKKGGAKKVEPPVMVDGRE